MGKTAPKLVGSVNKITVTKTLVFVQTDVRTAGTALVVMVCIDSVKYYHSTEICDEAGRHG